MAQVRPSPRTAVPPSPSPPAGPPPLDTFKTRSGAVFFEVKLRDALAAAQLSNVQPPQTARASIHFQILDEMLEQQVFGPYHGVMRQLRNEFIASVYSPQLTANADSVLEKKTWFDIIKETERGKELAEEEAAAAREEARKSEDQARAAEMRAAASAAQQRESEAAQRKLGEELTQLKASLNTIGYLRDEDSAASERTLVALQEENTRLLRKIEELEVTIRDLNKFRSNMERVKHTFAELERRQRAAEMASRPDRPSELEQNRALYAQLLALHNARLDEYEESTTRVEREGFARLREAFVWDMGRVVKETHSLRALIASQAAEAAAASAGGEPAAPAPAPAPPSAPASASALAAPAPAPAAPTPAPAPEASPETAGKEWRVWRERGGRPPELPRRMEGDMVADLCEAACVRRLQEEERGEEAAKGRHTDFQESFFHFLEARYGTIPEVVLSVAHSFLTALAPRAASHASSRAFAMALRGELPDGLWSYGTHLAQLLAQLKYGSGPARHEVPRLFKALYPDRKASEVAEVEREFMSFIPTYPLVRPTMLLSSKEREQMMIQQQRRCVGDFICGKLLDGTELRYRKFLKVLDFKDGIGKGRLRIRELIDECARLYPSFPKGTIQRHFGAALRVVYGPGGPPKDRDADVPITFLAHALASMELAAMVAAGPAYTPRASMQIASFLVRDAEVRASVSAQAASGVGSDARAPRSAASASTGFGS